MMHGCNGRMGQIISGIAAEDKELRIVAGVDINDVQKNEYPVFKTVADCTIDVDVVVDFGAVSAIDDLLNWCVAKQVPAVICTTGLGEAEIEKVQTASRQVAILRSANMSLGVNMLMKLLKEAANVLAPAGFDIEIVEKHHKMKVDAPSGTALALADSINEARDNEYTYIYDRSQMYRARGEKELGISAVRGGSIVGEHEVIFAGQDEVITFSHSAYSRAVFGKGAVQAAKFLKGKPTGLYTMSDVIG